MKNRIKRLIALSLVLVMLLPEFAATALATETDFPSEETLMEESYSAEEPSEPEEEPSEPAEEPSEPEEEPSEPVEEPSEPAEDPSEPVEEPSEPAEEPSEPVEESSEPAEDPSEPEEEPSEPAEEPSEPEEEPSEPAEEPSESAEEPSEPEEEPSEPVENLAPSATAENNAQAAALLPAIQTDTNVTVTLPVGAEAEYSFTPKSTGNYVLWTTDGSYPTITAIEEDGGYLDAAGGRIQFSAVAGTTYTIRVRNVFASELTTTFCLKRGAKLTGLSLPNSMQFKMAAGFGFPITFEPANAYVQNITVTGNTEYMDRVFCEGSELWCIPKKPGTSKVTLSADGFSATCTVTVKEDANVGTPVVTASNVASTGAIQLKWKATTNAVKYTVLRGTNKSGSYTSVATTTKTTWTDPDAKIGTKYYYLVRATDANGNTSDFSAFVNCTRCPARPAVKVSNNSATGRVKISWGKVSGATKYRVYRKVSGGSYAKLKDVTSTSFTDTTAKVGKSYVYTVKAYAGTAESKYVSGVTGTCKPARPVVKVANTASTGKVKISWGKISGATKYRVYRKEAGGSYAKLKDVTSTSYTDTTAKVGKTYYYTVRAYAGSVSSTYVSGVKGTCMPARPVVKVSSGSRVKISWGKISGATKYRVYRKEAGGSYAKLKDVTSLSFTDTTAKKGKTYYYTVRAYAGSVSSYYVSGVKGIRK